MGSPTEIGMLVLKINQAYKISTEHSPTHYLKDLQEEWFAESLPYFFLLHLLPRIQEVLLNI